MQVARILHHFDELVGYDLLAVAAVTAQPAFGFNA
jgi:hypothetical protein